MCNPLPTRARSCYRETVNGPAAQSYPSLTATIRAEILDATGPARRSRREAALVWLLAASIVAIVGLALALALVK